MDGKELFALAQRVKDVCGSEATVEVLPTRQANEVYLIVVEFPLKDIATVMYSAKKEQAETQQLGNYLEKNPVLKTAYFWEKQKIHNLHYEKILPLLGDSQHFRVFYCCGDRFVLYAKTFVGTMEDAYEFKYARATTEYAPDYIGIKTTEDQNYKYVGFYNNTDVLVSHLMTTCRSL